MGQNAQSWKISSAAPGEKMSHYFLTLNNKQMTEAQQAHTRKLFSHFTKMCQDAGLTEACITFRESNGNVGTLHIGSPQSKQFNILSQATAQILLELYKDIGGDIIVRPDEPEEYTQRRKQN